MSRYRNPISILSLSCLILLIVFIALFFTRPLESEDIWWHLSTARWMLQMQQFPETDIFSLNVPQPKWQYVQWLGGLIFYGVYLVGDLIGLKFFRVFLFLCTLGIFFYWAYRKIPFHVLLILIYVMTFGLETRIWLRPMIFNLIFIQCLLIVLFHFQKYNDRRILWFIPLISVIWNNVHLGCLIYGSVILSGFLLGNIIEWGNCLLNNKSHKSEKKSVSQRVLYLCLAVLGFFAVFVFNPYGLEGVLYRFSLLFQKDSLLQNYFLTQIAELRPPKFIFFWTGTWFHILTLVVIACFFITKKNKFIHFLLFIFGLFLFLYGSRAGAFYVLICGYVIVELLQRIEMHYLKRVERALLIIFACILVANITHRLNEKVYLNDKNIRIITQILEPHNALDAINFLNKHRMSGRTINFEGYGGQILWWGYPALKPFVETRQIDKELYVDYINLANFPEKYWDDIVKKYQLNTAILSTNHFYFGHGKIYGFLSKHKDWQFIYSKGSSVIAVKRGSHELPDQLMNYEEQLHNETILSGDTLIQPAGQKSGIFNSFLSFLNPPVTYIDTMEEGTLLFAFGFMEAGINRLADAYRSTGHPEAHFRLQAATNDYDALRDHYSP